MPLIHFVDKELMEESKKRIKKANEEIQGLEEHRFIATCLQIGLKIEDLKELDYKDVAKIMLCFMETSKGKNTRKATQNDWDRLAGRR